MKNDRLLRELGIDESLSLDEQIQNLRRVEKDLKTKVGSGDSAAAGLLEIATSIREVLEGKTHQGKNIDDALVIEAPSPDTSPKAMESQISTIMPSLKEALRIPTQKIGGRSAGKRDVTDRLQAMWDVLGDDAYDLDNPEPIFRRQLLTALRHYGIGNLPTAGNLLLEAGSRAFECALAIVKSERGSKASVTEEMRGIHMHRLAQEYAELTGIIQMPLKQEIWKACGIDVHKRQGNPLPLFKKSLFYQLGRIGFHCDLLIDDMPINPFTDTENVECAIRFMLESQRMLRDGRIDHKEAMRISKELAMEVILKLKIPLRETELEQD